MQVVARCCPDSLTTARPPEGYPHRDPPLALSAQLPLSSHSLIARRKPRLSGELSQPREIRALECRGSQRGSELCHCLNCVLRNVNRGLPLPRLEAQLWHFLGNVGEVIQTLNLGFLFQKGCTSGLSLGAWLSALRGGGGQWVLLSFVTPPCPIYLSQPLLPLSPTPFSSLSYNTLTHYFTSQYPRSTPIAGSIQWKWGRRCKYSRDSSCPFVSTDAVPPLWVKNRSSIYRAQPLAI